MYIHTNICIYTYVSIYPSSSYSCSLSSNCYDTGARRAVWVYGRTEQTRMVSDGTPSFETVLDISGVRAWVVDSKRSSWHRHRSSYSDQVETAEEKEVGPELFRVANSLMRSPPFRRFLLAVTGMRCLTGRAGELYLMMDEKLVIKPFRWHKMAGTEFELLHLSPHLRIICPAIRFLSHSCSGSPISSWSGLHLRQSQRPYSHSPIRRHTLLRERKRWYESLSETSWKPNPRNIHRTPKSLLYEHVYWLGHICSPQCTGTAHIYKPREKNTHDILILGPPEFLDSKKCTHKPHMLAPSAADLWASGDAGGFQAYLPSAQEDNPDEAAVYVADDDDEDGGLLQVCFCRPVEKRLDEILPSHDTHRPYLMYSPGACLLEHSEPGSTRSRDP